jgi:hypothetical protein
MSNGKKIALGASAAAVALGLGLGTTGLASAATTTPAPSASSSATAETPAEDATRGERMKEGRGGHGLRGGGVDAAELASKLGVEEAAVSDALQVARDAAMAGADTGANTGEKPDREAMEASLVTSLAEALGLDEATVQTAFDELRAEKQAERSAAVQERLDTAVADGSLTQAEADGAAKAVELGILGGGGRG